MNWAKARIILGVGLALAAACGGQSVTNGDGGVSGTDGGSSGTSGTSGTSGASGSDGGSTGTSGTTGTSGASGTSTSGTSGKVVCGSHNVASKGSSNNCTVYDSVQCGAAGTVNDQYDVTCQCNSQDRGCSCVMNNGLAITVTETGMCPTCDPSLLQDVFKKCGFPY